MQRHGAVAQIIVINVAVYLAVALVNVISFLGNLSGVFTSYIEYLYLPAQLKLLAQRPWTLLTYMFVHDLRGIFHLLFNMLWLFWMGQLFREYLGNRRVWAAFLGGALVGALVYITVYNVLPVFETSRNLSFLLGASAGVLSIVVATATMLPNHTIVLFLFGPVRLKWLALVMILLDFLSIPYNPGGMLAHLGGAAFGFLFVRLLQQGVNLAAPFEAVGEALSRQSDPSARNLRVATRTNRKSPAPGSPTEEEVDRILDKIKAVGYEKLTKEEKQTLFNASKT